MALALGSAGVLHRLSATSLQPVTSAVQPSADGAASSPPNSRQAVMGKKAWSSYAEESERMSHGGNPAGWPLLHTQGMLLLGC